MLTGLFSQKPELVQADAQIAHSTRKLETAGSKSEALKKEHEHKKRALEKITKDLGSVRKLADEAQGGFS